jgi:hypothetical protein
VCPPPHTTEENKVIEIEERDTLRDEGNARRSSTVMASEDRQRAATTPTSADAMEADAPLHVHSVVDDLGAEVTGIAFPVSLCMALVVALVRLLNRDGEHKAGSIVIAEAVYNEKVCLYSGRDVLPSGSGPVAGAGSSHT